MARPIFIAHRAGGKGVRENRLETIKASLDRRYVGGFEIDLRVTKDKVLIVHHDRGVYIDGTRTWVDTLNYDEIKHLGIPTMNEVFELLKSTDKIVNIDVKDEVCVPLLRDLIRREKITQKIHVDCFNITVLLDMQSELPEGVYFYSLQPKDSRDLVRRFVVRMFLLSISIFFTQLVVYFIRKKMNKIKIEGLTIYYKFATKSLMRDLKVFGYKVAIWGTDNEEEIRRFYNEGVYGIKTKNFSAMKKLTDENK